MYVLRNNTAPVTGNLIVDNGGANYLWQVSPQEIVGARHHIRVRIEQEFLILQQIILLICSTTARYDSWR
jgi:hypothetical protein